MNCVARRLGTLGRIIMRMLPVSCAHLQGIPLSAADFREWVRLDTFDMYAPAYDRPQTAAAVRRWFEIAGFVGIEVFDGDNGIVGRGRRPAA